MTTFNANDLPLTTEQALENLLEAIEDCSLYGDLEGGCNGEGPVVEAYRALNADHPEGLNNYLNE